MKPKTISDTQTIKFACKNLPFYLRTLSVGCFSFALRIMSCGHVVTLLESGIQTAPKRCDGDQRSHFCSGNCQQLQTLQEAKPPNPTLRKSQIQSPNSTTWIPNPQWEQQKYQNHIQKAGSKQSNSANFMKSIWNNPHRGQGKMRGAIASGVRPAWMVSAVSNLRSCSCFSAPIVLPLCPHPSQTRPSLAKPLSCPRMHKTNPIQYLSAMEKQQF